LLALLLAPDVDRERRRANERFARRPPQSLEEELAWQDEIQLWADADRIKQETAGGGDAARGKRELLGAAFHEAVRTLGRERLELLLGKKFSARKRTFAVEEARLLRRLLSGVDSEDDRALYCDGHAK